MDATQKGAGAQVAFGAHGQELFDLGPALEPWGQGGASGTLDLAQERLDLALEQAAVKRTHGIEGQLDGGRGLPALRN